MISWIPLVTIFRKEMGRFWRTLGQSLAAPVLSTILYFVVFGSAIGSRMQDVDGIAYGSFIVPGLIMLSVLVQSVSNAAFGIYFPRFTGTIYEVLSAPISSLTILLGYVLGATCKSMIIGLIILLTANFFVDVEIIHPVLMLLFLFMTSLTFSMLGFIIGLLANSFDQLQTVPMLILTPLTFLGGTFYSVKLLPPFWQKISMLNPVVYLVSGFRWSFFEHSDVGIGTSFVMIACFLAICLSFIIWVFRTGYRLKN